MSLCFVYHIIDLKEKSSGRCVITEFSIRAKGEYAYLLGDFNAFNEGSFRMENKNGTWRIKTELPEGIWHYAYSIGGKYVLDDGKREAFNRKCYNFSKETNVCIALGEGYESPFHCPSMIFPVGDKLEIRVRTVKSTDAYLLYAKNKVRMERFACDGLFEYHRALIPLKNKFRYHFGIDGKRYGDFEFENENKNNNKTWVYKTIFYQIMTCRFTGKELNSGTLKGLLDKIGHIRDLGVNALYLTPIFSSDTYHGYDINDYYKIDPELGNEKDFETLAQNKEIRIMLDGVFHHTSHAHPFFRDFLEKGDKSGYAGFYRALSSKGYETFFNVKSMPRLNHDNNEVYNFVRDVVKHWTEKGAAAWRMDVAHGVPPVFWEKLKRDMPETYMMGEVMDDARAYLSGFDGVMNYCLYEAILDFFVNGKSAESFLKDLQGISARYNEKEYTMYNFLDNHDTSRFLGLVKGRRKYLCALVFLFTYKGLPSLFYGDEIGLKKRKWRDEEQREQMVWDENRWDKKILNTTKELIALRKKSRALQLGSFEPLIFKGKKIVYKRAYKKEQILVGINYSNSDFNESVEWPMNSKTLSSTNESYSYFISLI